MEFFVMWQIGKYFPGKLNKKFTVDVFRKTFGKQTGIQFTGMYAFQKRAVKKEGNFSHWPECSMQHELSE